MDTALIVAGISAATAIASAVYSRRAQLAVKEEERRTEAKQVLDRYRGPLMDAAWQLGNRIDNIRHREFLDYLGGDRATDAKLTTLFRFANYFGWREFVRREVQLLRFEDGRETRLVAGFINDVAWVFSSDQLDEGRAMLWADEQRGIGELMVDESPLKGHAAFRRDYSEKFAAWMERFAADVLSTDIIDGDRPRLLQWALYGLVRRLDEDGAYGVSDWMSRAEDEIRELPGSHPLSKPEVRLREHLAELSQP